MRAQMAKFSTVMCQKCLKRRKNTAYIANSWNVAFVVGSARGSATFEASQEKGDDYGKLHDD